MFSDLNSIIGWYQLAELFSKMSTQLTAVYIALPVIALIVCFAMDRQDLRTPEASLSHNTIHTAVWLCIILMFPVVGALAYFLCSVLPYFLWTRKSNSVADTPYPYTCKLKRWQLFGVVGFGVIGILIGNFSSQTDIKWAYDLSFICYLVIMMVDWYQSVHRKAIYLQMHSDSATLVESETILNSYNVGKRFEFGELGLNSRDMKQLQRELIREIGDKIFSEMRYEPQLQNVSSEFLHNFAGKDSMEMMPISCTYTICHTEMQWRYVDVDVMDSSYLGKGVTEYTVLSWEEKSTNKKGKEKMTPHFKKTIYRVIPRTYYWFARMFVLQFVMLSLYTGWGAFFHTWMVNFISNLLE